MKYRKKPVVIDAFQMTEERYLDNSEWPEWLNKAWNKYEDESGCVYYLYGGQELWINTFEGPIKISYRDYIIQGVAGELYPCKPDIFEATHEVVEE